MRFPWQKKKPERDPETLPEGYKYQIRETKPGSGVPLEWRVLRNNGMYMDQVTPIWYGAFNRGEARRDARKFAYDLERERGNIVLEEGPIV